MVFTGTENAARKAFKQKEEKEHKETKLFENAKIIPKPYTAQRFSKFENEESHSNTVS